jgi:kynureninase
VITRAECLTRDAADPLRPLREQFALEALDERGVVYLDGNSLGVLPKAAALRVNQVVSEEWGHGLIRSWNRLPPPDDAAHAEEAGAGWMTLSARIGDKIARLIGVGPGEVSVGDSTSVNLFKVLSVAVGMAKTGRRQIVSERSNFPTDLYIADSVARAHGFELVLADDDVRQSLGDRVAMVLLTHVDYRTGRMHRMAEMTRAAHRAGALMIWDLSHSAGAMPVQLTTGEADDEAADFAVGCGYKYLNGGPGAPAFLWAHARHIERMDREGWRQPLSGWLGHAAPFAFTADYRPAPGMSRFTCGTPPVLSLAALECGVDTVLAAGRFGGLAALRHKSIALTDLFIELAERGCGSTGLRLVSPRASEERGSQVSFAVAGDGYAVMQALIARAVIGDFRAPDIIRFGFPPLYTRFVDVWDAVDRLQHVLASGEWREPRFATRLAVT